MLGHRGCRLGIAYPEISAMQARAVFEAAAECQKAGIKARPGNHDPARRLQEGTRSPGRSSFTDVAAQVQKEKKATSSTTWSAP